jgi:hypothetical protein
MPYNVPVLQIPMQVVDIWAQEGRGNKGVEKTT